MDRGPELASLWQEEEGWFDGDPICPWEVERGAQLLCKCQQQIRWLARVRTWGLLPKNQGLEKEIAPSQCP